MEGHARTRLKGVYGVFSGWPEKMNRKLIAMVLVALLLGVPALSMILLSVNVERQTVEIEPWSHRAFHIGIYGLGEFKYSYSGAYGSEVYLLELDRVSYYRFVLAGESFDFESYRMIHPSGRGSASTGGFVWDIYLVLANNGPNTAQVEIEVDARAFLSLLPAAAILLAVSGAAYWMGRQQDKKAHMDLTNPIVAARRPVRIKALKVIAVLSVMPIVTMLAMAAVLPGSRSLMDALQMYGLFFGMLISVAFAFRLRLPLTWDPGTPQAILRNLAYRLRVSGYRVTEEDGSLKVQISSTSALHITTKKAPEGTWVHYRAGATPTGFSVLIIAFFTIIGMPFALPLALFMLYRASAFASTRVLPRLSQLPIPKVEDVRTDTRALIIESLSEGRRLSAEAYESTRSNYHDHLIITAVVGLLAGTVVGLMAYMQIDSSAKGLIALMAGMVCAAVLCAVSWWHVSNRSRPMISEFKGWSAKLDAALSREVSGQNPSDSDPSAFEMIADILKEMPKWLKARSRAGGFRQPLFWVLVFMLLYIAFNFGYVGIFWLFAGRELSLGVILIAISAVLIVLAALSYRIWKKRLDQECKSTLSWWGERRETLRSEMEKILMGD